MVHQFDVVGVIAANLSKTVGELLTFREQLLEAGKTAIHGRPSRIDNLCIRQHQVDEPDVAEVIRHLVDKEGRALPVNPRILDECFAEIAQLFGTEVMQDGRIKRLAGFAPSQAMGERQDIRQLKRAIDLGMGRQNLLEQGRSCARQAEDEDRIGSGKTGAFVLGEQFGSAEFTLLGEFFAHRRSAVAGLGALEVVALLVKGKGAFVLLAVLECLSEREAQMHTIHER